MNDKKKIELWQRYQSLLCDHRDIGLSIDVSRMTFTDAFLNEMQGAMHAALEAMADLEKGAKANIDEDRMVGHYWLRAPDLAPDEPTSTSIAQAVESVRAFASQIHDGSVRPERADQFMVVLLIGIGGSALGPQFVSDALGGIDDPMLIRFVDNTDPDGIARVLAELDDSLDQTLTVVISKSGGTKETRNGLFEVANAYRNHGLTFARHAVAVTCDGSALHRQAVSDKWIGTFPMWDWVGGRTSQTSVVGLLPAALQGIDIEALLSGARDCDVITRETDLARNPAALLALMWYYARKKCDLSNMVILPYRDRLLLWGRYLQQLVMESLGKERNRSGQIVHEGLTVLGNKGSTDQHAFVQQLRDGVNDFFVTFVRVLETESDDSIEVEEGSTSADCLDAFWQGTREALCEKDRQSITVTLDRLDARAIGTLIALFERTVGLYAELININAYHQPGVEAGKKCADAVLAIQRKVTDYLAGHGSENATPQAIAEAIGKPDEAETVHHILARLKR